MKALANKVLILGIDGMDPKLTQKYINEGYMPNTQEFLKRGAAKDDLHMIGGQPTVTPPMWTTLSTGANPSTHGITDYYARSEDLDVVLYNFDSTRCKAEPLWNVTAQSGKKTLVWHWPGSSWPPTSQNENLHVVDGTQPGGPNLGVAEVDPEKLLIASENTTQLLFKRKAASDSNIPCFIAGMKVEEENDPSTYDKVHAPSVSTIAITREEALEGLSATPFDIVFSPIKPASGWTDMPNNAKECTLLNAGGLIHRPCLLLPNTAGIYDTLAIYRSKKESSPIISLKVGEFAADIIDDAYHHSEKIPSNRNCRLLEMASDGSSLKLWVSTAMDFSNNSLWHPKTLLNDIIANVGYPQPICLAGGSDERLISQCMRANWDQAANWNAQSLNYLARNGGYDVIFSHFHNIDLQGHMIVKFLYKGSENLSPETYQKLFRDVYVQTDHYIGQFLPLLDEGWTILIVSDHGQICPEHGKTDFLSGANALNAIYFKQWGYLTLKQDENGNDLHEVDWSKTLATTNRVNHIYINLKGREKYGIVDPKDQFELEERIMTDLYSLKDEKTGHRIISLALRNRDAILLGSGGPESGDIVYYIAQGYNDDHADSLSTLLGTCDTTVASIFMAAGKGIKENHRTSRVIKHVDVTPTIAVLAGVSMPRDCEGAPIYQILTH